MLDDTTAVGGEEPHSHLARLEQVGPGTATLVMEESVAPGSPVVYEVPGSDLRGEGYAVFSRVVETPAGVSFVVGIRTVDGAAVPGSAE